MRFSLTAAAFLVGPALAGGAIGAVSERPTPMAPRADLATLGAAEDGLRPVVIARRALSHGERLTPDLLAVALWPKEATPRASFARIADVFEDRGGGSGRRTLTTIAAGAPLLHAAIGLAPEAETPPQTPGVTLRLNAAVASTLGPGDAAEIRMTQRRRWDEISKVVLRDAAVIALGENGGRGATVRVPADEAQRLALAMQTGRLSLSRAGALERPPMLQRTAHFRIRRAETRAEAARWRRPAAAGAAPPG